MQKQQQKVEETASSSSSSSSSSFLEDIENNITVDLTKLNIDQLGVFNRLIAKVDDHRHVCINRVAFKHLIDNLDKAVKEEEMKEKVEEETKEEVEEKTKEESVSSSSSSSSSSFLEESQSDIIDLTQLHVHQLELFHRIIEIADEVDDLRHVRVNKIALKYLFDNLDEAVEEEEEVKEEEVEEEEVEEEEGETEEESVSSYFLEEIHDNIIIDLTRIRVDKLGLFYRLIEAADETDDLKRVSINRTAFNCLIYNFDEGLDEEEEE